MGRGQGQRGQHGGGLGPGGYCICSSCGHKVKHQIGKPCYDLKCPKSGSALTRE